VTSVAAAVAEPMEPTEVTRIRFQGPIARFMKDRSRFICLEGSLNCGKTTACLVKEFLAAWRNPGIWSFIGRFTDGDNDTKLIPAWEAVVEKFGVRLKWNSEEKYYGFPNGPDEANPYEGGSRVYSFGLMSPVPMRRYAKLRGLGVSRFYIDQAEELPSDFLGEITQRMRQQGYEHQLTLSPNPMDENSWMAEAFPIDESGPVPVCTVPNRSYYGIAIFDNAHNLPAETIEDALTAYPVTHASHRSKVLGKRGLNVVGKPVYGGMFNRALHWRRLTYNKFQPLEIAFDFGKHHPCMLVRQRNPYGGVHYLAGVMGQSIFLEDFLPVCVTQLGLWFGPDAAHEDCCDPAGSHDNSQGVKVNGVSVLKSHGFAPKWVVGANRPSIRVSLMERIGGLMRRRTPMGEAYGINNDPAMWLRVTATGAPPATWHFLADGCEAGYVWDEHLVSEGSKQYRKAKKDGWYEHAQNCQEYLELNFSAGPKVDVEPPPLEDYRPSSSWT
jgi:hypothetical protein